ASIRTNLLFWDGSCVLSGSLLPLILSTPPVGAIALSVRSSTMTAVLGFAISGASGRCAVTSVAGAKRLKLYFQKVTQKLKVWSESMWSEILEILNPYIATIWAIIKENEHEVP